MTATPAKTRSPNYPIISLGEAVTRLRTIYDKQQTYAANREVIAKLLGYGGLNGASSGLISALSKYGLLEGHGDQLRVSAMGQDVALHRRGDSEYTEAIRDAAFMPVLFRELHDQYPHGLPSEHTVRAYLVKKGFNPKTVDSAIRAYRDTLEFVDAETEDSVTESPDDTLAEVPMQTQTLSDTPSSALHPPSDPRTRSIALPLSVSEWATLQAPVPMTEAAWNQMIAVLNAMKPALVTSDEKPTHEEGKSTNADTGVGE